MLDDRSPWGLVTYRAEVCAFRLRILGIDRATQYLTSSRIASLAR